MDWNFTSDRPIYLQLMEQIKLGIAAGAYRPGDRLPSVRELAADAAVNPNTMQKALSELEREGLVYSQRTSGRFISEDTAMLDAVKQDLARAEAGRFLDTMARLGYDKATALDLLSRVAREEE
mgnify:CR=1 FL=1